MGQLIAGCRIFAGQAVVIEGGKAYTLEYMQARMWSDRYPVGTLVELRGEFPEHLDRPVQARTSTRAILDRGGNPVVGLEGYAFPRSLSCLTPVKE